MCSDLSVFKDTVGENAMFFDPNVIGSLEHLLEKYRKSEVPLIDRELNFQVSQSYRVVHQVKALEEFIRSIK